MVGEKINSLVIIAVGIRIFPDRNLMRHCTQKKKKLLNSSKNLWTGQLLNGGLCAVPYLPELGWAMTGVGKALMEG